MEEINLGTILKRLRKRVGLTQEEVAILAGVTYTSYRKYETSGVIPNFFDGIKILGALQVKDLYDIYRLFKIEIYELKMDTNNLIS